MNNEEEDFLKALQVSFAAYEKRGGARSTKKLIPPHRFLSHDIGRRLGDGFSVRSLGVGDGKEVKFSGKYYPKDLDIAVLKEEKVLATISFKFVTSNYKQNANNYFENLMGEAANIRREGVGFAHLLVLRGHTPYFSKNKGNLRGKEQKIEIIKEKDIQKYVRLWKDLDFPHKPDLFGICILEVGKNKQPVFADVENSEFEFSSETIHLLRTDFSLKTFLEKFKYLVQLKA